MFERRKISGLGVFGIAATMLFTAAPGFGCSTDEGETASGDSAIEASDVSVSQAQLTDSEREQIVVKKATCPFAGTAVSTMALKVLNTATRPLAFIKDVIALGDTGNGDLGSKVLVIFAHGNHALMRGPSSTKLDEKVPDGTFSLDFPGSKGSHPGHSGILQDDPRKLDSGRFDESRFEKLLAHAEDGHLRRSKIALFIAENLRADPQAKVFGPSVAAVLKTDKAAFVRTVGPVLLGKLTSDGVSAAEEEAVFQSLTKLLGEDNLVGSAGEFGLLFAFLQNMPNTIEVDGEPAIAVGDVTSMFERKTFPEGWEAVRKTKHDWVVNTTALMVGAATEYLKSSGR